MPNDNQQAEPARVNRKHRVLDIATLGLWRVGLVRRNKGKFIVGYAVLALAVIGALGSDTPSKSGQSTKADARDTPADTPAKADPAPVADSKPKALGKYDSDWADNAGDTTCRQWRGRMSGHQRFVMAADMLSATIYKDASRLPPDSDVRDFAKGVTTACEPAPSMSVAEIGSAMVTIMTASK